jgi:hypothetical protein
MADTNFPRDDIAIYLSYAAFTMYAMAIRRITEELISIPIRMLTSQSREFAVTLGDITYEIAAKSSPSIKGFVVMHSIPHFIQREVECISYPPSLNSVGWDATGFML